MLLTKPMLEGVANISGKPCGPAEQDVIALMRVKFKTASKASSSPAFSCGENAMAAVNNCL